MAYPWSANDILTAADLNAAISTGIISTGLGAWTSYTPTWSGTLGNGTLSAAYQKVGRLVNFRIQLTWGSTTSHAAAAQTFTVPVTAAAASQWVGGVRCYDSSATTSFMRHVILNTTTQLAILSEAGAFVTNAVPMTWATSDLCYMQGTYESAS